jgi:hypothetical protein
LGIALDVNRVTHCDNASAAETEHGAKRATREPSRMTTGGPVVVDRQNDRWLPRNAPDGKRNRLDTPRPRRKTMLAVQAEVLEAPVAGEA